MTQRPALRFLLLQVRLPGDEVRDEERASFATQLQVDLDQVVPFDAMENTPTMAHLTDVDAVLVGGAGDFGVVHPNDPIEKIIQFLTAVTERGFPMFASCFGFQALVVGLGGRVIEDNEHAEVGVHEVRCLPSADDDPVFSSLPATFLASFGHKDRAATLPRGVTCLATTNLCPYQAIRVDGTPVWATQFHPELTGEENRRRFLRYEEQYGVLFGKEKAQALIDGCQPTPACNGLLVAFIRQALSGSA